MKESVSKRLCVGVAGIVLGLFPVFAPGLQDAYAAGQKAVIQTIQADWSGAAHAVADVFPAGGPREIRNNLFPNATSDWLVRSYGQYFYLIGRYFTDSLTRFHVDAPETPIYQVSVLPDGIASSNPHDLIFAGAGKAYMPMYGLTRCWIVNPQDGAKTGELDFSAYADLDGAPEMHTGVIACGKLFIILQRLENWDPVNRSYVAVFDTATDLEIDTTGGALPNGLKGIELPVHNATSIQYLPESNTIYISAVGAYPSALDPQNPHQYTGGIISLDPETYAVSVVVDDGPDGPDGDHPYGAISGMTVVTPQKGYFIGYRGWGDNSLYPFDPTTGAVGAPIAALDGKGLSINESGGSVDRNGLVWISAQGMDHAAFVINPSDDSIDEKIDTGLNPESIAFCPPTVWKGSNAVASKTNTGTVTIQSDAGVPADIAAYAEPDFANAGNKPEGKEFGDGLVGFRIEGIAGGETVTVDVQFPSMIPDDALYYKIDGNGDFYLFPSERYQFRDGNTVRLVLTDGGIGDRDGVANGVIVDPGGWAAASLQPDPAPAPGGSGGGGGCFIDALLR